MVVQPTECEEIAGGTQAGNLSDSDSRDIGPMAKFFPLMNIGEMHLNGRQADRRNGVPDCDAGVGVAGRVNDDPIVSRPSLLNPGDQFTRRGTGCRKSTAPWSRGDSDLDRARLVFVACLCVHILDT
jgi:hypothetical protein